MKKVLCAMFIVSVILTVFFSLGVAAEVKNVLVTADGDEWAGATYDTDTTIFKNGAEDHVFKLSLNAGNRTATLLHNGTSQQTASKIVIPSKIEIDGTEYYIRITSSYILALNTSITKNDFVEELVISEGITDGITGSQVFRNAMALKKVTLPSTLTTMPGNMFYGCTLLESIEIPELITSIPGSAFQECKALTTVTFNGTITSIGASAFRTCESLENFDIPGTVTSIGTYAFNGCKKITELTIPDGIETIGASTFSSCLALTAIDLPDSITSIGNNAFTKCTSLTAIDLPDSITSIGSNAFEECTALTKLTLPKSLTSIGASAFYKASGISELVIPAGVTEILNGTFNSMTALESLTFKGNVTSLGADVFKYANVKNIRFEGITAPATYGAFGAVSSNDITVYYPIGGTGYGEGSDFRAYFPSNKRFVFVPFGEPPAVTSAAISDVSAVQGGYTVDYAITLADSVESSVQYVALYNGTQCVAVQSIDADEPTVTITTSQQITKAKIFVWEGLLNVKPLCAYDEKTI